MLPWLLAGMILAQNPSPTPVVLSPDWLAFPPQTDEYAHYVRHTEGAPDDFLTATQRVCDCRPERLVESIVNVVQSNTAAKIKRSFTTLCGQSAQHLVVTGIAQGTHKNIDLYAYRANDAMTVIAYGFSSAEPSSDDEADMQKLCRPATGGESSPAPSASTPILKPS